MKYLIIGIAVLAIIAGGYFIISSQQVVPVTITSGGATFPYPIVSKWISEYNKRYPHIQISYQPVGSGAGISNLLAKTFDFAGSDAPLTDEQLAKDPVIHIPWTMGGVVVSYNIPGIGSGLKLTPDVIAKIFQGNITKWNDPEITSLNPGINLPDREIVVVRRSDSSGTTYVFTSYLKLASKLWVLGSGTTIRWPVGLGAPGNPGVASTLIQTPYSIGYLEFFYAHNNSIPYAAIKNRDGEFILPSLQTLSNAAKAGAALLSKDVRSAILNLPGKDVYPIAAFTYALVYRDLSYMDINKARAIVNFIWWAIHEGQNYSEALLYPKLPSEVVKIGESLLKQVTHQGRSLI
ncbi:MAG: phosphate ABC transporter substrate-binding protein PstS [Candidatus Methanomethyliaceae archaeon]|nr:phosphate ABC transporter substrate-binding protein PstS [Candidatus Methanomethyliaceae archaeon]MDW7970420.1 phosphate ABC transporter substrate-binding protein PstS [Nitrososphaerota archaeon]